MKNVTTFTSVLLLNLSASAANVSVPLAEKPLDGNPVHNTGTVVISEGASNGMLSMSFQTDWAIKNISSKTIVAVVETMLVQYSNGSSDSVTEEYDAFFHPQLLNPGDSFPMGSGGSNGQKVIEDRHSGHSDPACEVAAQWVQFADGSTFGDVQQAKHLLASRKLIFEALGRLDDVYKSDGAEVFLSELLKPIADPHADGYIEHLRQFEKQHTVVETYQRLDMHLQMAKERIQILGEGQHKTWINEIDFCLWSFYFRLAPLSTWLSVSARKSHIP